MKNIIKHSKYAYVRVSRQEQKEDRQLIALEPYGIPEGNLFLDKQSGKDFNRPAYKRMVKKLKRGDLLYLKSVDRLGRNYAEIIEQWKLLTQDKGVDIIVLDMPLLDTTYCKDLLGTFISDLVLQVLSFSAQLERDNLLQRQAEGIAAAKAKGVKFGRAKAGTPEDFVEVYELWRNGQLSAVEAAGICGFGIRTLYDKTAKGRKTDGRKTQVKYTRRRARVVSENNSRNSRSL